MKFYNKLITTIIVIISITTANATYAAGHRGEKAVGVTAGYNTRNESAIAGLYFQYRISRLLRISPDITYIFRNNSTDGLAFNINLQIPLSLKNEKIRFYPLAGINYTSWSFHPRSVSSAIVDNDDVTSRVNKLALNVGGGFEIIVTPTLRLFVEGKYTGVKNYSTGTISSGIGYRF